MTNHQTRLGPVANSESAGCARILTLPSSMNCCSVASRIQTCYTLRTTSPRCLRGVKLPNQLFGNGWAWTVLARVPRYNEAGLEGVYSSPWSGDLLISPSMVYRLQDWHPYRPIPRVQDREGRCPLMVCEKQLPVLTSSGYGSIPD